MTAEFIRRVGILCQPFIPSSAGKLLDILAVPHKARSFADIEEGGALDPGALLPAPQPIFPRYVEPETQQAEA